MSLINAKRLPTNISQTSAMQAASSERTQTAEQVRVSQESILVMPPGGVIAYGGIEAPEGFLLCDGKNYAIEDYPQLAQVLGVRFGGTTTEFNVPDLRGRVIVAPDTSLRYQSEGRLTSNNDVAQYGGTQAHPLTAGQMPKHKHTVYAVQVSNTAGGGTGNRLTFVADGPGSGIDDGLSSEAGNDEAHPNLQPYLVLNYIIKY